MAKGKISVIHFMATAQYMNKDGSTRMVVFPRTACGQAIKQRTAYTRYLNHTQCNACKKTKIYKEFLKGV